MLRQPEQSLVVTEHKKATMCYLELDGHFRASDQLAHSPVILTFFVILFTVSLSAMVFYSVGIMNNNKLRQSSVKKQQRQNSAPPPPKKKKQTNKQQTNKQTTTTTTKTKFSKSAHQRRDVSSVKQVTGPCVALM